MVLSSTKRKVSRWTGTWSAGGALLCSMDLVLVILGCCRIVALFVGVPEGESDAGSKWENPWLCCGTSVSAAVACVSKTAVDGHVDIVLHDTSEVLLGDSRKA